jgi:A/G-specific adenine glycosylase
MPWRRTRDPYRIWISEVMLQQTRVDQAWAYYERFTEAFPTVEALAAAPLDDLLRQWEGLGYYARARNLHRAAREVVERFGSRVPDEYDAFRSLPGVGPYTAAAVLSIAFGKPYAVLDGNVARVLARVFRVDEDVKDARTRRLLQSLASELLAPADPSAYNQALMEVGATICTPRAPSCPQCPLHAVCRARQAGIQEQYPITTSRPPIPHYDIAVGVVFNDAGEILIQRRPEDAMLGGLWEFPGGKREPGESLEGACRRELREELQIEVAVERLICRISHAYSHFKITLYAYRCRLLSGIPITPEGTPLRWVTLDDLSGYAFPRANRRLIETLLAERNAPSLF